MPLTTGPFNFELILVACVRSRDLQKKHLQSNLVYYVLNPSSFFFSKFQHLFCYVLPYQFQIASKIMILLHVTIEETETSQLGGVGIVRLHQWEKFLYKSQLFMPPKIVIKIIIIDPCKSLRVLRKLSNWINGCLRIATQDVCPTVPVLS